MNFLYNYIESTKEIQSLIKQAKSFDKELIISGVKGSLNALITSILIKHTSFTTYLIIAQDNAEQEKLFEDLIYYSSNKNILKFPGTEIFVGNKVFFDDESKKMRYETLCQLYQDNRQIIITTPEALETSIPDIEELIELNIFLHTDMTFSPDKLTELCTFAGYERENTVERKGAFSRRGGIVDIFPVGSINPVRIEFDEEKIDSIRLFDLETQRSIEKISEIEIHPKEEPQGKKKLQDYLPRGLIAFLLTPEIIKNQKPASDDQTEDLQVNFREKIDKIINYSKLIEIKESLSNEHNGFNWHSKYITSFRSQIDMFISDLYRLKKQDFIIFIICDNAGQKDRMLEILEEKEMTLKNISVQVGKIFSGFEFDECKLAIIKDDEIFGRYEIKRKYSRFRKKEGKIDSYLELRELDYVVHVHHGIGQYLGIERLKIENKEEDFIKIMYSGDTKIYVPISQLNLVQKYIGDPDNPPELNTLGTSAWSRSKERVKKAIEQIAKELVEIYATREILNGHAFKPDAPWQSEFENSFIYEETPDQLQAVKEIKEDMEKLKPMDRLLCGDVGYGKTEVAIRACFKAAMDGLQVAVLVPTTILAQQHLQTFSERMADYPAKIDLLNRFRTKLEQKNILEKLGNGEIDIIIGTHRLLQQDIKFKNLGLLVIDEEHRFGVKDKEKIKNIRKLVDVLSLTATPIPRTLQMALVQIRDMSVISTPPPGRIPIKIFVIEFDKEVIKNAILQEMKRGGQIFYVHNRVETIEAAGIFIQELVPDIKIAVAHGQMHGHELEKIMLAFMEKKFDILICTTIIESGLDIPNVNTVIIENSDRFGLAQLYQLKGRVGRGDRLAYAYLLYDNKNDLTHTARKRLEAISEITELGSGFKIAMKDMEIRGAGNLLGTNQHGHVNTIGYDLYCDILKECIEKLRGKIEEEKINPEINIRISNFLPDEYILDNKQKIYVYKKLASLQEEQEIDDMKKEMEDRFGKIPIPVNNLLEVINIKIIATKVKAIYIKETKDNKIIIKFAKNNKITPDKIMRALKQFPKMIIFFAAVEPELTIDCKLINTNKETERLILIKKILQIIG